ncbi:MAG TPA: sulfite exporter TauE/SafE family protein [Usitatibacter sp.]|nr:sulfite exporter TauE/SafE family protein [Usitatibacter sp.]
MLSAHALPLLFAAVGVAAFVQGTTGVGFALILAPVLAIVAPQLVPVCLLALMIPLNVYVAWRERRALDWRGAGWITAARFVGTFGGLWILAVLSAKGLALVIGAATVLASIATLVAPSFEPGPRSFLVAGLVTGVSETATGIGGPPLALVYQHRPAPTLRSTIAFCFLAGEVVSLALLALAGRAGTEQFLSALLLAPALGIGALASRAAHHRVGGRHLRMFVLVFAIVSGAALLVRG